MDINPYQFKADFREYEFANYHVQQQTDIILCSMAWLSCDEPQSLNSDDNDEPNHSTIDYWCSRLLPYFTDSEAYCNIFQTSPQNSGSKRNVLFVVCNRTGTENGLLFILLYLNIHLTNFVH
jgi:protein N-terminal amidase